MSVCESFSPFGTSKTFEIDSNILMRMASTISQRVNTFFFNILLTAPDEFDCIVDLYTKKDSAIVIGGV
jgi:hypothetical protein